jgi:transposase-like protein
MADDLNLLDPRFQDAEKAAEYLESIRWGDGVVCPHCGESEREPYRLNVKATKRRVWKCRAGDCRKQFTVMVGTIFESSHVPLNKWLLAFYLLCSSKKGMSAHQLHRGLGVTYKTAWFMFHRIREAMSDPAFSAALGGVVEVDETYIGGRRKNAKKGGRPSGEGSTKVPVVALVERGGRVRSERVANVTARELGGVIRQHVAPTATLMTDEWRSYIGVGREYAGHGVVSHGVGEYVRGENYTNTVEGFFSILKRGVNGTYHHVSRAHLHRYLSEFDFRYNSRDLSDAERTVRALADSEGKRLKYRDSTRAARHGG